MVSLSGVAPDRLKKKIGLSIKADDDRIRELAQKVAKWLLLKQCEVFCDKNLSEEYGEVMTLSEMAQHADLLVVLGGDGLLLHASRKLIDSGVPILGINLGRMGFLTDTPVVNMFDVMTAVLAGQYKVKSHFALKAECRRGDLSLGSVHAVNDIVLHRQDYPRPIEFEVDAREQLMFRLRGDGLIVATPAGSTAYALSAGGPIVHPEVEAIAVVPLCPHTMSNRPIVVPASDTIDIRVIGSPSPSALNYDGQQFVKLVTGDSIHIQRDGRIDLIYLQDRHYFKTLRTKLKWAGHDD